MAISFLIFLILVLWQLGETNSNLIKINKSVNDLKLIITTRNTKITYTNIEELLNKNKGDKND